MNNLLLGVIADDFTGATDIASMLVRGGLTVVQTIGVPSSELIDSIDADAIVVALKSRSIDVKLAVAQSLDAMAVLQRRKPKQFYFKYCSTFDSTKDGNIGPVADALAATLDVAQVVHVPALPVNGRTVYQGNLFVFNQLLSECGMQDHPINPMTDSNIVRWLGHQTEHKIANLSLNSVRQGAKQIRLELDRVHLRSATHIIADATSDADLDALAYALQSVPLVAGGSGLATPLAKLLDQKSSDGRKTQNFSFPLQSGQCLLLAGSCSLTTLEQIEKFIQSGGKALRVDPIDLAASDTQLDEIIDWAAQHLVERPVLIFTSGTPEQIGNAQKALGVEAASDVAESAMGAIATTLVNHGSINRLLVAGGETSGAVVSALNVSALHIGNEIAPGVPWTIAVDEQGTPIVQLALKSGNFGGPDFFCKAIA